MTGEIGREWLEHDFDKPTRAKAAGRYRLLIVDGHTSHFNYDLLSYVKENEIIVLCLPSNTTHALQSEYQQGKGGWSADEALYIALDVLGFSQFKRAYEEAMEERALVNESRISKGEFLVKIKGPFRKAFTKENIRKSFEVTGTWPVDRSKITTTQLAPAKGLSIRADPITNLTSPVKVWVNRMDTLAQLGDKPAPVLEFPIPSSDPSPSCPLQSTTDNDNYNEDGAINAEFHQT